MQIPVRDRCPSPKRLRIDVALEPPPEDVQQDLPASDPRAAFLEAALWLVRGAS